MVQPQMLFVHACVYGPEDAAAAAAVGRHLRGQLYKVSLLKQS
jgi:hypothetical protein